MVREYVLLPRVYDWHLLIVINDQGMSRFMQSMMSGMISGIQVYRI